MIRASSLEYRWEYRNGNYVAVPTSVDAYEQALEELKAQGVTLLSVPA